MKRIAVLVSGCLFVHAFALISSAADAHWRRWRPVLRPAPVPLSRQGPGYWTMPEDTKSVAYAVPFKAVR